MKKKLLKILIFSAAGLLIFYFLLKNIELADFKKALINFNWRFSFLALGLYILMNFFRALRFNFFFKSRIGFKAFLKIVLLYNFWNQILPFRSGELSYIFYLRKTKKVLMGENIASLMAAKVFDLFVVVLFALVGMFFVFKEGTLVFDFSGWFGLGVGLVIFIFVSVVFLNRKMSGFFEFFFRKTGFLKFRLCSFLSEKLKEALEALSAIKSVKRFFAFLGYSTSIWLVDFFVFWSMSAAAGIKVSFWQAVVLATLLLLAVFILPFQTPGNIGTYEGSLALVYLLIGFEKNIAVSAGLLIHIQNFIFTFILFLFTLIFRKWLDLRKTNI